MTRSISAAEANRQFSQMLRGVREEGATYVVTAHGRPVARIVPVDTSQTPRLSPETQRERQMSEGGSGPATRQTVVTEHGLLAIPQEILTRFNLTAGTPVDFVEEGDTIRLLVRKGRRASDPQTGFGMVKVESTGRPRRLGEFDPASLLRGARR